MREFAQTSQNSTHLLDILYICPDGFPRNFRKKIKELKSDLVAVYVMGALISEADGSTVADDPDPMAMIKDWSSKWIEDKNAPEYLWVINPYAEIKTTLDPNYTKWYFTADGLPLLARWLSCTSVSFPTFKSLTDCPIPMLDCSIWTKASLHSIILKKEVKDLRTLYAYLSVLKSSGVLQPNKWTDIEYTVPTNNLFGGRKMLSYLSTLP